MRFALEPVSARIADRLRTDDHWHPLTRGEELGEEEIGALWEEQNLADVYARALGSVRATYVDHVALIDDVVDDLGRRGAESWIARALRHRFAFDATWEALDRLGELTHAGDQQLSAANGDAVRGDEA